MSKKALYINCSPSGNNSGSHQIARYAAHFIDAEPTWIGVSDLIPDQSGRFRQPISKHFIDAIATSDLIVWTFGAHVGFVPALAKLLFDQLLLETDAELFSGRLAAVVCTSGRLHDDVAIRRVGIVSECLGMYFIGGVSILGNSGLYYEEEEISELKARRFASMVNIALGADRSPLAAIDPRDRIDMSPLKRRPEDRSSPHPTHDLITLESPLILTAFDETKDAWGQWWIEMVQSRLANRPERIDLSNHQIHPCTACLLCNQFNHGACVIRDKTEELRKVLLQAKTLIVVTPISAMGESYFLKVFLDRLWVDIHQQGFSGRKVLLVSYGGGRWTETVTRYLERWMTLMGMRVIGSICDTGLPRNWTDVLDFELNMMRCLHPEDQPFEGDFEHEADLAGIHMLVYRWGHILRNDYRHLILHHHVPWKFRFQILLRWWLFGSPTRFRRLLKMGRWAAARRRQKRLDHLSDPEFSPGGARDSRFIFET